VECGAHAEDDCCQTTTIPGGSFLRDYDGQFNGDSSHPATVSPFVLDAYEVSVARFRRFTAATVAGWMPPAGSGKHLQLNGGAGLSVQGTDSYEPGWDPAWNTHIPDATGGWQSYFGSCAQNSWTNSPGTTDVEPINCVDWYVSYAFCIWDGGFLPSDAEWNFAASGGGDQRVYPWSLPPTSDTISCSFATFLAGGMSCGNGPTSPGSHSPKGDGRWGQADLAGNLAEWVLDTDSPGTGSCDDCVVLSAAPGDSRAVRGGAFDVADVRAASPDSNIASDHTHATDYGFRCAR
jgi:formylglycine-generating enzyme required for sulfatase activity